MILNFYFDLPCRTSPRLCSQGFSGGGVEFLSYKTCILIPKEDSLTKYDTWFLNGGNKQP